ncbi:helix-turn-helix domain-containing protein [Methylobacterium sp. WL19]|nr:helix-turn-helix domain-containing protein [Methylobacterium sp. WL19]
MAEEKYPITARHVVPFQSAARELGLSPATLRRLCKEGIGPTLLQISTRRLGVRRGDLDAWVESRKVTTQSGVAS